MTQPFVVLDKAKSKLWTGAIAANTHVFRAVLSNNVTISNSFAGVSGNAQYSDVSATEVSGSGYTTGGMTVTVGVTQSGANAVLTYGGLVMANTTITCNTLILIDNSATNRDIVAYSYLDPTGGTAPISATNGPLTHFANSGISQY